MHDSKISPKSNSVDGFPNKFQSQSISTIHTTSREKIEFQSETVQKCGFMDESQLFLKNQLKNSEVQMVSDAVILPAIIVPLHSFLFLSVLLFRKYKALCAFYDHRWPETVRLVIRTVCENFGCL